MLKTLLDFSADIEASGIDDRTSLIHVARIDNLSFAMMLLKGGADINATSTAEQTPLTTAIIYNSHRVLQLLLDQIFEYSECSRLKDRHLLEIVALDADLKTIRILIDTDPFKLKYDKNSMICDFVSLLRIRLDITNRLTLTFDDLLSVTNCQPDLKEGLERLMESDLLSHQSSGVKQHN